MHYVVDQSQALLLESKETEMKKMRQIIRDLESKIKKLRETRASTCVRVRVLENVKNKRQMSYLLFHTNYVMFVILTLYNAIEVFVNNTICTMSKYL